jgi:hypothetical protein
MSIAKEGMLPWCLIAIAPVGNARAVLMLTGTRMYPTSAV